MLILSQRIVVLSGVWALLSLIVLGILGSVSFEYFFVLYLLGFLVLLLLFGPFLARPGWRSRASVITLIGVLLFSLITIDKILTILHITFF